MLINGVTIGDRFKLSQREPHIARVVDILEKRSLASGEVVGHACIAQVENGLATNKFEVSFSTVVRNAVPSPKAMGLPDCGDHTTCNRYQGGKQYKPYLTADYMNIGYDEKDTSDALFKALVEIAGDAWEVACERYVAEHGDVGTCVGGAGIAIHFRKPKCRKYERKLILRPPHTSGQGASTWEHSVEEIVAWLKAHGIECWYHCGYMD